MPEIGTELKAVLVELKTSIIKVKFENIINVNYIMVGYNNKNEN